MNSTTFFHQFGKKTTHINFWYLDDIVLILWFISTLCFNHMWCLSLFHAHPHLHLWITRSWSIHNSLLIFILVVCNCTFFFFLYEIYKMELIYMLCLDIRIVLFYNKIIFALFFWLIWTKSHCTPPSAAFLRAQTQSMRPRFRPKWSDMSFLISKNWHSHKQVEIDPRRLILENFYIWVFVTGMSSKGRKWSNMFGLLILIYSQMI